MDDRNRTKEDLISELIAARQRLVQLDRAGQGSTGLEDPLPETEERFRKLAEVAPVGIFIYQRTKYCYVNPASEAISGYTRNELYGMDVLAVIHPDFRESLNRYMESRQRGEPVPGRYEVKIITKQGEERWADCGGAAIEYGGKPAGLVVLIDITDRKRAEQALEASSRFARSVIDALSAHIAVLDEEGTIIAVNKAWRDFAEVNHGVVYKVCEGANYLATCERVEGEDREEALPFCEGIHAVMRGEKEQFSLEYPCHSPSENRWFAGTATRFRDPGPIRVVVSHENITEKKLADDREKVLITHLLQTGKIAQIGSFAYNLQENRVFWSEEMYRIFGVDPGDGGLTYERINNIIHPEDRELHREQTRKIIEDGQCAFEHRLVRPDGSVRWIAGRAEMQNDDKGTPLVMLGTVQDVTDRKQAEEALQQSESLYRTLTEQSHDAIYIYQDTRLVFVNDSVSEISGYSHEELIGMDFRHILHPDDRAFVVEIAQRRARGEDVPQGYEARIVRKDGEARDMDFAVSSILYQGRPAALGAVRDITERKRNEEQLRSSLREKEVLLKEIHHRVKNNLQVISSLLNIQSRHVKDPSALAAFRESIGRVRSMALVHDKLYRSKDLAHINFREYLKSLTDELLRSYQVSAALSLDLDAEDVFLPVDIAIPLGLVVNELVANAMRHAFPEGRQGKITINLRVPEGSDLELTVADNGVGFPEHVDFRNMESLGLKIVIMLVEDQLKGTVTLERRNGTVFVVNVPAMGRDGVSA